jgi:hypothetical protein
MPFPFLFVTFNCRRNSFFAALPIPCYASRSACEVASLAPEMIWWQADKTWRASDILAP